MREISRNTRDTATLLLLTFASATTDILAFIGLGAVFTSAMTGNTAMLGIGIGEGQAAAASRALVALLSFVAGAVGATLLGHLRRCDALTAVLAFEALCLALFTVVWTGWGPGTDALYPLIVLSAVGMGAQSVGARRIDLPGIPTVVFTSTLTNICMAMTEAALRWQPLSADTVRQIAAFFTYLCAAALAGVLGAHGLGSIIWLPLVAVLAAIIIRSGLGETRQDDR
jgi:uncharacterized membrane protein YoaK (UPF0700 family)